MMKFSKDHVLLHVVILIWGFTGILGKLISIPSETIVWYRMGIAALSLLVYFRFRPTSLKVSGRAMWSYLGTGVLVALHWGLFFEALKVSNVSVTLATLATATLFTGILEPLFFKRKVVIYEMVFGILVVLGLGLIFKFESGYTLGIILALCSAFCASLFTTLNGVWVAKGGVPRVITWYEMLGGVLGITLYLILTGSVDLWLDLPTNLDWFYLILLGVVCTAFAFVASVAVMKELSPFTVSISINMEPIYAIILALIFFGEEEKMTPEFYLGAILIMSTIFGNAILKRQKKAVSTE